MYVGMNRFDVRKQIMADLAEAGLVEKVEDYVNKVATQSAPTRSSSRNSRCSGLSK